MSLIFQNVKPSFGLSYRCNGCMKLKLISRFPTIFRSRLYSECTSSSNTSQSKKVLYKKSFKSTSIACPLSITSSTGSCRFYSLKGKESFKRQHTVYPWWHRIAVVGGVVICLYALKNEVDYTKELEEERVRYEELNVKTPLGGDWELIDDNGRKRSSQEFKGHWMLIYFGFTHCPDICPEEMEKLTKIVNNIDRKRNLPNLQPMFISVDPDRDTPKVIKEYLKDFKTPRVIGLTAESEDEIREVTKKFRVYFGKGPKDEDNDYIIDHTIILYLINCEGKFVNYYGRGLDAAAVTASIETHMEKYKQLKKKRMI